MKKNRQIYSKRKYAIVLIIGILVLLLSFACLIIGAILQSNGADDSVYLPLCLAFFPLCLIDIIFLIYHIPGTTLYETKKKADKIKKAGYETINNPNTDLDTYCLSNKFVLLREGYYHKKQFNLLRDRIHYYIQKMHSSNIQETLDEAYSKFNSFEFKSYNQCLLLFIEKENIIDDDLNMLINTSAAFISSLASPFASQITSIIVLIDANKNCAYCVSPAGSLGLYNLGYKMAKKILCINQTDN